MKLTILFQYGSRPYLEQICRDFLKESLGDYPYDFIDLDCSNLTIGAGYNRLVEQVKTEFVMTVLDDFGFFPATIGDESGQWVKDAITILDERRDIGIIQLRKENDCIELGKFGEIEKVKDTSFINYEPWDNRGWVINPIITRTEVLKQIVPLDELDKGGNVAETSGWEKWKKLGLKTVKLNVPYKGVCFHLGWHRSKVFGWKDKL